jgi:hypothetical protein
MAKTTIAALGDNEDGTTNWHVWDMRFRAHMRKQRLWPHIERTAPPEPDAHTPQWTHWNDQWQQAFAKITLLVSDPYLVHCQSDDPAKIYDWLKLTFATKGAGTIMILHCAFIKKRFSTSGQAHLRGWITEVTEAAHCCKSLGYKFIESSTLQ